MLHKKRWPYKSMGSYKAIVILLAAAIFTGCTSQTKLDEKDVLLKEPADITLGVSSYVINGHNIDKAYEVNLSDDHNWLIYSASEYGKTPDIYIYRFDENMTERITDNPDWIETAPHITDEGNFAYIQYEDEMSKSYLVINNSMTINGDESDGHFRCLDVSRRYILTDYCNSSGFDYIQLYSRNGELLSQVEMPLRAIEVHCLADDTFIIQGHGRNTLSQDVISVCIDMKTDKLEVHEIAVGNKDEYYVGQDGNTLTIDSFQNNISESAKMMFNSWYYYFFDQYCNPFCGGNDYTGRISWNGAGRLWGLSELYEQSKDEFVKAQIYNGADEILSVKNGALNIFDEKGNDADPWSSKRYSPDRKTLMLTFVENVNIAKNLLSCVDSGAVSVDSDTGKAIIETGKHLYDYYESRYSIEYIAYCDDEGEPLPYNQQADMGTVSLYLYKLTGEEKYSERVEKLAKFIKSGWKYFDDGRIIWNYSPNGDGYRVEDISHGGLCIDFAMTYLDCADLETVFSESDLSGLNHTLAELLKLEPQFSYKIDGSGGYAATWIPASGWVQLNRSLLMGKWENVLITHPTFDSQRLRTYSYLANNNESVESQLTITRTRFDIDSGSPISADETFYVEGISSIKEYAMKSVWYPRGFHPHQER